ncbi:MAG TPA: hypothetical protein VGI11_14710 [Variovorax sp.]
MKHSMRKLFPTLVAGVLLASFGWAPMAQARGGGGGGMGGGGGGMGGRAGGGMGGGGGARAPQVNNRSADVRTNDVRNTSVNSVNVNRNTNVVVAGNGGCCNNRGWDNDYHPVATAAAVTAAVAVTSAVVGSMVQAVPAGCAPVNYAGYIYQQCGAVWYQPQGSQYVVVNPPY